jgi:hypothetical protein
MNQLRLATNVDADFLTKIEVELVPIIYHCLMEHRNRVIHAKIYRSLFALLKPLSLFGLATSLLILLVGGWLSDSIRFGIIGALFFLLFTSLLAFSWNTKKREQRLLSIVRPYWLWLARVEANTLLNKAKKAAPYIGEYDFRGNLAAYYRTKNENSTLIWTREILGFRLPGHCFTLLFKNAKSLHPYAIILHDLSGKLESYLDELGIQIINHPGLERIDY